LITIKQFETRRGNTILLCRSCESGFDYESIIEDAIIKYFEYEKYLSYTEGNTIPLINCPECGDETYNYSEEQCVYCGTSVEHICSSCHQEIVPEEIDGSGFCGCVHMMNKDD